MVNFMSPHEWGLAYLSQSRSDFKLFLFLSSTEDIETCHALHFLQMATEKLSKGVMLLNGNKTLADISSTHSVLVDMMKLLDKNRDISKMLGFSKTDRMREYIKGLIPEADRIEKSAPALSQNGVNTEYPWLAPNRTVIAPADYEFQEWNPQRWPRQRNFLDFISRLLEQAESIFGP